MPTHSPKLSPSVVELDGPFVHGHVHSHGIRLHTVSAGSSDDPLIVLLHGAFGGWFEYRHVISPLAQAGYRVVAVDLRGYGMSDHPPSEFGQDIRSHVGYISGLISALGYESAYIIGYDTGGTIGWALASTHPGQVNGLVAIASSHPVDLFNAVRSQPWNFLWILVRAAIVSSPSILFSWIPRRYEWFYRRNLSSETTSDFAASEAFTEELQLRIMASRIGRTRTATIHNNRLLLGITNRRWLDQCVHVPVTMIHADQGLWKQLTRRSAQRLRAPWKALTITGTKNMPHIERPASFVDCVYEQLSSWVR